MGLGAFKPSEKMKERFRRQRAMRLRFRRRLHIQKQQVGELSAEAERRLENDFFKRLERLGAVKRFVSSWLLLLALLIGIVVAQTQALSGYYQTRAAVPGGTYTEGVLGAFTNANPIYATALADTTVSELLFAGLLTYDRNNRLTGDLAERWTVDETGTTYTVTLKPDLVWHDGAKLTAADAVFTYRVIQNPDARSPLFNSWAGIDVSAADERTVVFTLPNPLASFPYSLTTGIVPRHILGDVPMVNMRSISFNSTQPVGAGPFRWQAIELTGGSSERREERIALKAFSDYHAGKPKLNAFAVRTFRDADRLTKSFLNQELNGVAGLAQVPEALKGDSSVRTHNLPMTAAVMTFFRTQEGILADKSIRQALVAAADTNSILSSLPYPAKPVRQALLSGQVGYDRKYDQGTYDPALAIKLLSDAGWTPGKGGIRFKDNKPLTFSMYFLDTPEYQSIAKQLADYWRAVGVDVKLAARGEVEMRSVLAQAPSPGSGVYDALLYGISIGADPDVYVYWHSSQIDLRSPSRLNFSGYSSPGAVDAALEAGRTRMDASLRAVKYQPFLQAWKDDAPALGLYQPRFLYLTRGSVDGLDRKVVNNDAGRLSNVHNWQIRKAWATP